MLTKSPPDARDWRVTAGSYPDDIDYRSVMMPVRNQGNQGACVAMTAAAMKEWQEYMDDGFPDYMSPQFIYDCREGSDPGMHPRDLMRILTDIGTVPEAIYPYGEVEQPTKVIDIAAKYKIAGYARIDTVDEAITALAENGPFLIAVPVYKDGFDMPIDMWRELPGRRLSGAHAMTVVGKNADGFIIRNSYGDEWGDKGHCIFPYTDWGMQWEAWTCVDVNTAGPGWMTGQWWKIKPWLRRINLGYVMATIAGVAIAAAIRAAIRG